MEPEERAAAADPRAAAVDDVEVEVVTDHVPAPAVAPEPFAGVRRATLVVLGGADLIGSVALDAFDAVARRLDERPAPAARPPGEATAPPSGLALVPAALVGLGLEAQRRALVVAAAVRDALVAASDRLPRVRPDSRVEAGVAAWHERGALELERARTALVEVVRATVAEVIDLVVSHVDVDQIVARVDVDQVVARVDVDQIVARVDVEQVVARVDVDRVVARVDVEQVVARVDVNDLLARVDVNALVDQVDVQAVVDRVDVRRLVDEMDLPGIVRESSGTLAGETVTSVRLQAMRADGAVQRGVDRVLGRRRRAARRARRRPPEGTP